MRKLVLYLSALLLMLCMVTPGFADEAPLLARKGVLRVCGEVYASGTLDGKRFQNEYWGGWTGSAFVVSILQNGTAMILTNRHCVDSVYSDKDLAELARRGVSFENKIYIVNDDSNHMVRAEVVAISKRTDLALLRVSGLRGRDLTLKIWNGDPDTLVQQTVYTAGFPGASEGIKNEKARNELKSDLASVTFANGRVTRIIASDQTEYGGEVIQHTAATNSGNSGGPLLDEDGNVVGVNTWGSLEGEQTYWSISNKEIISFLKENRVSFQEGQRIQKANPASLALIIGVVLAVILFLFALRQRNVNREQSRKIEELLRKRLTQFTSIIAPKKEPQVLPKQEKAQGSAASAASGNAGGRELRCDIGELAGKSYSVRDRLVIGRDPSKCDVVFGKDVPNVSRVHCTVRFDGQKATIKDENSSYGVFIDGKRIRPGVDVPLHRGHKVGIGSAGEQVFSLHNQK